MEEMKFEYRQVVFENFLRFKEIYKLCFGMDVNDEYFRWKYLNNPAGRVIAFEAIHNGNVAGFYGVIPERYLIDGKVVSIYQSMDTMTHPSYQKRGLFTKLAKLTYDHLAQQEKDVYIVGIPGMNSFYGFVNKLGWKNLHSFRFFFLNRYICKILHPFKSSSDYSFKIAEGIDHELDRLLNYFIRSDKGFLPYLDKNVLAWKVFTHPYKTFKVIKIYKKQELIGYGVCSVDESARIKIELLKVKNIEENAKLVVPLSSFIFKTFPNSNFIYTWEPLNTQLKKFYKAGNYMVNPYSKGVFSYRVPHILYGNNENINGLPWFNISNFDVQPLMQD